MGGEPAVSLGFEYNPIASMEYTNSNQLKQDVVDNLTWEPGFSYIFSNGIRAGILGGYYRKKFDRGGVGITHLKSFGAGAYGDYGYEITDSGRTLLVVGMEAGYGRLTDENDVTKRSTGGTWVAGIGGIRRFFSRQWFMEMDFRMKWLRYDFTDVPAKEYDFSGATIRINLNYIVKPDIMRGGSN